MREIKFRAWDSISEEMLNMVDLVFDKTGIIGIRHDDLAGDGEPEENPNWDGFGDVKDYPIMQFTGLSDKNGKEIYEGDVVKYKKYLGGNFVDEIVELFKVIYQGVSFQYKPVRKDVIYTCSMINNSEESVEVIGNVYENPELLNQES